MDLLGLLANEIASLKITDKELIARYLYIRTGELFEYHPAYDVANSKQKEELEKQRLDIRNIQSFQIICHSWSAMYCDLLISFGIEAKVITSGNHSKVLYKIDNKYFTADITSNHEDIYRIKFGLKTNNQYQLTKSEEEKEKQVDEWDRQIGYRKGMQTETALSLLKQELKEKFPEDEAYLYHVYEVVRYILNVPRKNINLGNVSGRKYIRYLLKYFLEEKYQSCTSKIFNIEKDIYIQVYGMKAFGQSHFFVYQEMSDGHPEFQEVNYPFIHYFLESSNFQSVYSRNLKKAM